MRVGDLVEWQNQRWLVRSTDREMRMARMVDVRDTVVDIPDDLPVSECHVLDHPSETWPFITLAARPKMGRLDHLERPSLRGDPGILQAFYDWVVSDSLQVGGAVFLNPAIGLRIGDVLVAVYEKGRARVSVTAEFGTARQRQANAAPKDIQKRSAYDRLLKGDFDDDE